MSFSDPKEFDMSLLYLTLLDMVHCSSPSHLSPNYMIKHIGRSTQIIDSYTLHICIFI